MLVDCFGSFLLQDMFLNLQVFAFEGQDMTFTVKVLFTCILYLYCGAGPGCNRTVSKYSRQILITDIIFFFGDALALLRESYTLV